MGQGVFRTDFSGLIWRRKIVVPCAKQMKQYYRCHYIVRKREH